MANDDMYGLAADEDILTHWEEILPHCNFIAYFVLRPNVVSYNLYKLKLVHIDNLQLSERAKLASCWTA